MHFIDPDKYTRRAVLARAGQLAIAGAAAPLAINLAAIGEAAAFNRDGYRALVCIFLSGGNDQDNTVVPYDLASYDKYHAIRGGAANRSAGGLALAHGGLGATALAPAAALAGGRQYALHPALSGVASLFQAGRSAVVLNVGPLVAPITRAQYFGSDRANHPLPPKLFSHNDQTSIWQSSSPEGATSGWGGRIGDLALTGNGGSMFTCISASGNGVLLAGRSAQQYQVTIRGPLAIDCVKRPVYGSSAVRDAITTLMTRPAQGMLENEYSRIVARSIAAEAELSAALATTTVSTAFSNGNLSSQLKVVAQIIAARQALGVSRQVFMVTLGGFDNHGGLISQHGNLMRELNAAISSFYAATVELGVADQVTTFTASEFGRTLAFNGDGSDHGWGSHHLVVGGAVKGGAIYGTPPPVSIGNGQGPEDQWHVGQGRLLPTTSLDQYAATLATWLGVEADELEGVLPNLGSFGSEAGQPSYPRNLGFV